MHTFEAGKNFEMADYKADDRNIAQLYDSAVTPRAWCAYVLNAARNFAPEPASSNWISNTGFGERP